MINKTFRSFQQNKSTGFIPYIVGGHPDNSTFLQSLNLLDQMGADMIEVGVPFSDPIAEGKTIERAHHYSLQNNFKIDELLSIIQNFRKHSKTPIILMGYTNSFIQPSIDNFCKNAKDVGINGFLIVDLPYSETEIINTIHKHSLETIQLIAPTSTKENIELGLSNNPSLIYYITQRGVTGLSNINMSEVKTKIDELRAITNTPIITGFGIKSENQAQQFKDYSEGIVIGSAIVEKLSGPDPIDNLQIYLEPIIKAIKNG